MRIDSLTGLKKKVSISLILELVGCGDPGMPVHGYKTGANYWAGQMLHLLVTQDTTWKDLQTDSVRKTAIGVMWPKHVIK